MCIYLETYAQIMYRVGFSCLAMLLLLLKSAYSHEVLYQTGLVYWLGNIFQYRVSEYR